MRERLTVGRRVRVPWAAPTGRRSAIACGWNTACSGTRRLKPLAAVIDEQCLLTASMLQLSEWIADRYLCPLGQVLEAVVPSGVRGQAGTRMTTLVVGTDGGSGAAHTTCIAQEASRCVAFPRGQPATSDSGPIGRGRRLHPGPDQ